MGGSPTNASPGQGFFDPSDESGSSRSGIFSSDATGHDNRAVSGLNIKCLIWSDRTVAFDERRRSPVFTTDQLEFATAIAQFCEKNCATAEQREALTDGGRLSNSPEMLKKFAELGWLGVSLPVEYGGGGAGMVEECIFLEETARGLAPIHAYGTGLTAAQTYLRHGDEQQKKEVLGNLCSGHFEAIALSEPGAGSDLSGVATKRGARRRSVRRQRSEDLDHRGAPRRPPPGAHPHRLRRRQAPRADAALSADRLAGTRHPADPDDGRPYRQRRVLHRRVGARWPMSSAGSATPGTA